MEKAKSKPTLVESLIPIVFLIILIIFNVAIWGGDTLDGSNQIALLTAAALAALIGARKGYNWMQIREQIVSTIGSAMPAILILLLIGALAGTWLISGVVPALIYYGLDVLHPSIFLAAAMIICVMVSLATGSSWSSIATIGVALLGIGHAMGFNDAVVAGAIVSGAYFGDKISPLSDTTNLAPAMAGTDLFTHIRYMMFTTIPSISIALIIFFIMGFTYDFESSGQNVETVQNAISSTFTITPWLFLVPAILFFIIIKKVPPLPALAAGVLLGGIFAIIFQPQIIEKIAITNLEEKVSDVSEARANITYAEAAYEVVMQAMYGEVAVKTNDEKVNKLFNTSGMAGMLNTIWLILSAMVFGGVMQAIGMLKRITESIIKLVNSDSSLITSTAFSCMFFNATASDQYIAIVVPGKMYSEAFKKRGLKPEVLSRTLEDSGTVTSVLIPWNTCGATQSTVLGVPVLSYLPYAFFNLISPFMTILFAYLNIKIRRFKDDEEKPESD
jgi:NhaC family Na+:H+ antiporter